MSYNLQSFYYASSLQDHRLGFCFAGLSLETFQRYASYDGDADRIVYYTVNSDGKFILLDGDKIASLFVLYIKELLDKVSVSIL